MHPLAHTSAACKTTHRAMHDTLDVIGGKWKMVILAVLFERTYRFKELSRQIDISPRILSKELQELEQHQLVRRTVCDTRPVTVEYSATDYSHTLHTVIHAMRDWGLTHHQTIVGTPQPAAASLA